MKKLFNKDFILLWQGNAVSAIGDVLYSIAIGIWVFNETGSTALMGIMSSISMFVSMFLSPFAGVLTDRLRRKNIIVLADFVRGLLMCLIGWIAYCNALQVYQVLIVAFLAGVCNVFFSNAYGSLIVSVMPQDKIIQGQSIVQGTNYLIQVVGKGISGTLIALFGVPIMIMINGASFLFSSFTELFITPTPSLHSDEKINPSIILSDFKDGLKYILSKKALFYFALFAMLLNFLGSGMGAILYPFILEKGFDMSQYAMFMSIESLAAFVALGILAVFPIPPKHRKQISIILLIVTCLCSIAYTALPGFTLVTVFNTITSLANVAFNGILSGVMIKMIDEDYRGKVLGLISCLSNGGVALSSVAYGFVAQYIGSINCAILFAVIMIVPYIWFMSNKLVMSVFEPTQEELQQDKE